MSNLQEKYDLELTNKDDIIADLQNRLDTALRSDDFKEKYEYLGKNLEFAWVKKSQSMTEADAGYQRLTIQDKMILFRDWKWKTEKSIEGTTR